MKNLCKTILEFKLEVFDVRMEWRDGNLCKTILEFKLGSKNYNY